MAELRGRTLPPPAKPKRRGHEPPTEVGTVVDLRSDPRPAASDSETEEAPVASVVRDEPTVTDAPEPAKPTSTRVTVYSDMTIEDFFAEVRVQAAIRRLDLTDSAVWRWAMTQLMDRFSPDAVVDHFAAAAPDSTVGRPRR